MLKTKTKMRIARIIGQVVRSGRRIAGRGEVAQVARGGVQWELDLREGIDLALFLNLYQKIPRNLPSSLFQPGAVMLDIGANIGAFTLALAQRLDATGTVIAVEPTDYAYSKLNRNLSLNEKLRRRVLCRQVLLTDGVTNNTPDALYASWPIAAVDDSRHSQHQGVEMSTRGAQATSLDVLLHSDTELRDLRNRIAVIKLDVDGHELSVLRGGQEFITDVHPYLIIEFAPYVQNQVPGRFGLLLKCLEGFGYSLVDPSSGRTLPYDEKALTALIPDGASKDLLCLPG